jgi:hypothetical protein
LVSASWAAGGTVPLASPPAPLQDQALRNGCPGTLVAIGQIILRSKTMQKYLGAAAILSLSTLAQAQVAPDFLEMAKASAELNGISVVEAVRASICKAKSSTTDPIPRALSKRIRRHRSSSRPRRARPIASF